MAWIRRSELKLNKSATNLERRSLLRRLSLFAGCTEAELAQIAALQTELHFPTGKALIRQGAPGREAFVIVEGEVRVERDGDVVARLGAGELVGEAALLADVERNATVVTETPTVALVMSGAEFRRILAAAPSVDEVVEEVAAQRAA